MTALVDRAVRLMRSRADIARAGRWFADVDRVRASWQHGPHEVATCAGSLPSGNALNAEHIASWDPTVALTVADLTAHEPCQGADEPTEVHARYCVPFYEKRDAVARAYYLNETRPCGHRETVKGCGGCDPGAIEFVITDDGTRRPYDPAVDMRPPTPDDEPWRSIAADNLRRATKDYWPDRPAPTEETP